MNTEQNLTKFSEMIKTAIEVRENAIYEKNPLFRLPLTLQDEDIARKELALLMCLLDTFNKMFPEGQ